MKLFFLFIFIISNSRQIKAYSEEEIILNERDFKNFSCIGKEPLTWHKEETSSLTSKPNIIYDFEGFNQTYKSILMIKNASINDIDFYYCQKIVKNLEIIKKIYIYVRDKEYLSTYADIDWEYFTVNVDFENFTLPCRPTAPEITVLLIDEYGKNVTNDVEYDPRLGFTLKTSLIDTIINPFICLFEFKGKTKLVSFALKKNFKPRMSIYFNNFYNKNETAYIKCEVEAEPFPIITWWYSDCQIGFCYYKEIPNGMFNTTQVTDTKYESNLIINPYESFVLNCSATNPLGFDFISFNITVSEYFSILHVWRDEHEPMIFVGDEIDLHCSAPIYKYASNITWSFKDSIIHSNDQTYSVIKKQTKLTYQSTLRIKSINANDSGIYVCTATLLNPQDTQTNHEKTIIIQAYETASPQIERTNLNATEIMMDTGAYLELFCYATGIPTPEILWKKDTKYLSNIFNNSHVQLSDNNSRLTFYYLVDDDTGEYSCEAENRIGFDKRFIRIIAKSPINFKQIIIITTLSLCSVVLLVLLIRKVRRFRLLKKSGILNFEEGDLQNLNPDLDLNEQVDLLPYDQKWEFPRNQLKIGEQIGFGAFGIVMKAEAIGIIKGQITTTVAVKMVKQSVKYSDIKALASELKIMIHMGKHLNIVNLLGACTKNVTKRELLVIVEYCKFGNLYNYLRSHRDNFINQIDADTGLIDFSKTFIKSTDHYYLTPKHLEAKRNEKTDENDLVILTKDLISWSFQIARGMDYSANKKVLHGDLAARNILLAENNVVKICDFGLSKNLYYRNNYKKKKNIPLPVKWMAVESIWDRVFSTQSDVWSYGVVLWELFSLAETPYPFMVANRNFFIKLKDGYRMEQPQYSTTEIYEIMLDCWQMKPSCRPSFAELVEKFENILESSVCKVYLKLTENFNEL